MVELVVGAGGGRGGAGFRQRQISGQAAGLANVLCGRGLPWGEMAERWAEGRLGQGLRPLEESAIRLRGDAAFLQ